MNIIKTISFVILICCLICSVKTACHTELTQIRANSIKPIITMTNSLSAITSFTVTFSSQLPSNKTYTWGLGLIGYQSYLTGYFCFNITANVLSTSLGLSIKLCETTYISMLKFRYIATSLDTSSTNKMQLKTGCYKCLYINSNNNGYGNREQSIDDSENITVVPTLKVQSFIYAFNISNTIGNSNYFKVTTNITSNKIQHTIYTSQNMTVTYVCLTVITWVNSTDRPGTDIAAFMDSYLLNSVSLSSNMVKYQAFQCANLGFYGFSMINHNMGGIRLLEIIPGVNSSMTYNMSANNHFLEAIVQVFYVANTNCSGATPFYDLIFRECFSNCTNALMPINSATNNTCVGCPQYCVNCSSETTCTNCKADTNRNGTTCTCATGYFDYSGTVQICVLCQSFIKFCISCTNNTSVPQGVQCLDCGSNRTIYNNLCQCRNQNPRNTFQVSNLCLNYPGCLNASGNTNSPLCGTCNTAGNFIPQNNINCTCKSGFSYDVYKNYDACEPVCGTGYVEANSNSSICDDNNTVQTDGCFNNCTVRPGWLCSITSGTTGPSFCIQKSSLSFTYIYSKKIQGSNQAQIIFQVISTSSLSSTTFSNAQIQTNISHDNIKQSFDSSTNKLIITIDYNLDMQSNTYLFNFTFPISKDSSFYSQPVQILANTVGINQALVTSKYATIISSFKYLLIFLSFGALIIALFTSIFGQKLMGLQLILPIQATYFMIFTIQNIPLYINQYKNLAFSNGYNKIFTYNYQKYLNLQQKLPRYDYQVEFLLNFNVSSAILFLSFIIFVILQLIYYCKNNKLLKMQAKNINLSDENPIQNPSKNQKDQKNGKQQQKKSIITQQQSLYSQQVKQSKQNIKKYVNNYYFFINIFLCQSCFFAFIIQNSQKQITQMMISQNINMIIAYIDILIIIATITFMVTELADKKDKRMLYFIDIRTMKYPVMIIIVYTLIAICSALANSYNYSSYIVAGLSLLPLFIFLYYRPYTQHIFLNTLGSILTQFLPILSSTIYLIIKINKPSQMLLLILSVTIASYIMILQIYTIFRLCKIVDWSQFNLCKKCTKKKIKMDDHKKQQIEMSVMIKENMLKQNQGLNWQQRNRKQYQSVVKPQQQEQSIDRSQNNDQQQNQLMQFKKKLKKQLQKKRGHRQ